MYGNIGNGGRHFPREDNCKRHLRNVHGISAMGEGLCGQSNNQSNEGGEIQAVDMDELTKLIRKERKFGRRQTE